MLHTAELVDFSIEKWNVKLDGHNDLITKRPYKNKSYQVASRRIGRRAVDGIFFEVEGLVSEFTTVSHWLHDYGSVVEHVVHYKVIDTDYDAISDDTTMWHGASPKLGGWEPRWPVGVVPNPARHEHKMTLEDSPSDRPDVVLEYGLDGLACYREETFRLPTLQRDRVVNHLNMFAKRVVPDITDAIKVTIST
jgi:hypothetical protein